MPKKILVADDSVVIQKSIGITFAQEDYQVTFVGNGDEAFQKAKESRPDLILADTSMPKLSGAELCKKFRGEGDLRRTPIILLASASETYSAGQLKACGANDFVQKPFESTTLLEKVKTLLSQTPEVTGSTPKPSMEQSIDQVFSKPRVEPEEETAISSAPIDMSPFEKSDSFSPDDTLASFDAPNPSPNTLASLDVLAIDDSDELNPSAEFAPYEEEKTKTVEQNATYDVLSSTNRSAPSPTPPAFELTEKQIEEIVARVFKNVIERIAWEVVPEMAERIIKEELMKITDDSK